MRMSTKSTLVYGKAFHLYTEALDDDNIWLELDIPIDTPIQLTNNKITIAITTSIWEVIREYTNAEFNLLNRTDEELKIMVEKAVNERKVNYEKAVSEGKNANMLNLFGLFAYGLASNTIEDQIKEGMAYMLDLRDKQNKLFNAIQEIKNDAVKRPKSSMINM